MDKKSIIGAAVCVLLLIVYFRFGAPMLQEMQKQPAPRPPAADAADAPGPDTADPAPPRPLVTIGEGDDDDPAVVEDPIVVAPGDDDDDDGDDDDAADPDPPMAPAEAIDVDVTTDLFNAVLTSKGGAVKSMTLRDFFWNAHSKETLADGDLELVSDDLGDAQYSLALIHAPVSGQKLLPFEQGVYRVSRPANNVVVFEQEFGDLRVSKTLTFNEGQRHVDVDLAFTNLSGKPQYVQYRLRSAAGLYPDLPPCPSADIEAAKKFARENVGRDRYLRAVMGVPGKGDQTKAHKESPGKAHKAERPPSYSTPVPRWTGVQNRYFAVLLRPLHEAVEEAAVAPIGTNNVTADFKSVRQQIAAGETLEHRYFLYAGPKSNEAFAAYPDAGFEALLDMGWFDPIARVLGWIMHGFHSIVGNYGFSILLLTVLVRLCLFPLTLKGQASMQRMQKLQRNR